MSHKCGYNLGIYQESGVQVSELAVRRRLRDRPSWKYLKIIDGLDIFWMNPISCWNIKRRLEKIVTSNSVKESASYFCSNPDSSWVSESSYSMGAAIVMTMAAEIYLS